MGIENFVPVDGCALCLKLKIEHEDWATRARVLKSDLANANKRSDQQGVEAIVEQLERVVTERFLAESTIIRHLKDHAIPL